MLSMRRTIAFTIVAPFLGACRDTTGTPRPVLPALSASKNLDAIQPVRMPMTAATMLNDHADVAGFTSIAGLGTRAKLWTNGTIVDLDAGLPGPSLAIDINDRGDVLFTASTGSVTSTFIHRGEGDVAITPAGVTLEAVAMNSRRDVTGRARFTTPSGQAFHAFLWRDGTLVDLGTLGGTTSRATAINDRGVIVGTSTLAGGGSRAFIWEDGVMTALPTFGGNTGEAVDVNERGDVAGTTATATGQVLGFLYRKGEMTPLPTLGGTELRVIALNDKGVVAGTTRTAAGEFRGVLWQDGQVIDLGVAARPVAINNRGQVLLDGIIEGIQTAALWEDGVVHVLPAFDGRRGSIGVALNERGEAVGQAATATSASGVLWTTRNR